MWTTVCLGEQWMCWVEWQRSTPVSRKLCIIYLMFRPYSLLLLTAQSHQTHRNSFCLTSARVSVPLTSKECYYSPKPSRSSCIREHTRGKVRVNQLYAIGLYDSQESPISQSSIHRKVDGVHLGSLAELWLSQYSIVLSLKIAWLMAFRKSETEWKWRLGPVPGRS